MKTIRQAFHEQGGQFDSDVAYELDAQLHDIRARLDAQLVFSKRQGVTQMEDVDELRKRLDALEAKAAPAPDTVAVPVETLERWILAARRLQTYTAVSGYEGKMDYEASIKLAHRDAGVLAAEMEKLGESIR